jgi:UDP-N-acetylglucosamine acyltransferase
MTIHPTAVIAPEAKIEDGVSVGAYTVIAKDVTIAAGTQIGPHAYIEGHTRIGRNNTIGPFTSIGTPPQDLRYKGEPTRLVIGDDNLIREYASLHRGTVSGHGVTTIGNANMIMAYCHVAHDCILGDKIIMANSTTLGGHVEVRNHANLGGFVAIHQFTRVGEHAYIGGMSGVSKDVPPYVIASGVRGKMRISGINRIGLRRCGYDDATIKKVNKAFVYIFNTPSLLLQDALEKSLEEFPDCEPVTKLVDFFRAPNRMGVLRQTDAE